jgi:hypothetical protein
MVQEGDEIVINAHKHWISNALDPRTAVHLLLGKSHPDNPPHKQQSLVIIPADSPGITIVRPQSKWPRALTLDVSCESRRLLWLRRCSRRALRSHLQGRPRPHWKPHAWVGTRLRDHARSHGASQNASMVRWLASRIKRRILHLGSMRAVGMAERCLDFMLHRATDPARVAFGKQLYGGLSCPCSAITDQAYRAPNRRHRDSAKPYRDRPDSVHCA